MKARDLRVFGGGIFLVGAILLTTSILFLTIFACGLFGSCTTVLHWPTILPALALMLLGSILIGWSFRRRSAG
ncbi:MAG: hypothetical protein ACREDF_05960 [Thermoplasmata archaeon]